MIVVVALTLSKLGAAQECEGFVGVLGMTPDQLKKEIQSNVAAALKQGELNTTLEKVVDVSVEKHLLSAAEEVIANISNLIEQLVSPVLTQLNRCNTNVEAVMTQLHLLRVPGGSCFSLNPVRTSVHVVRVYNWYFASAL